jgi:hypothetical protein
MKSWWLPIAVLGLSGLGLLYASKRGRGQLQSLFESLAEAPEAFGDFNKAIEDELECLQRTLDQLAAALEA